MFAARQHKPKLPYDIDKDFVALSRVAPVSNVVAVHPSLGVGTAHAESPVEFTAFIKGERERIARVGRQVSITLD